MLSPKPPKFSPKRPIYVAQTSCGTDVVTQTSYIFTQMLESLPNRYGTVHYNWPMSAHASQAFNIAHCTDSEDLPKSCRPNVCTEPSIRRVWPTVVLAQCRMTLLVCNNGRHLCLKFTAVSMATFAPVYISQPNLLSTLTLTT